jgi:hypothetical protein
MKKARQTRLLKILGGRVGPLKAKKWRGEAAAEQANCIWLIS